MVQVKKPEVRQAILLAATQLFTARGYHDTTVAQIASKAKVSTANVYVYFQSKIDILYSIYEPWLRERLTRLELELREERTAEKRMFKLLHALWCEIPAENNGFANNFMQAITSASPESGYRPELLQWARRRITAMLRDALPPERRKAIARPRFTHLLLMAFDGFVIGRHLYPNAKCDEATIALMTRLILGGDVARPERA
jgi:AcrR family transcriptional regulator